MCRKGAWVESAAKVTVIRPIQSKACGVFYIVNTKVAHSVEDYVLF